MFILVLFGFLLVFFVGILHEHLFRTQEIRRTHALAKDIVQSTKEKYSLMDEQIKTEWVEKEHSQKKDFDRKTEKIKKENSQKRIQLDKEKKKQDIYIQNLKHQLQEKKDKYKELKENLKNQEQLQEGKTKNFKETHKSYMEKIAHHFSLDVEIFKNEISQKEKQETETILHHFFQKKEEQFQEDIDKDVVRILNQVIDRFSRPYCPERGIGAIILKSKKDLKKLISSQNSFLNYIEKECGVDIVIDEESLSLFVQGLDPVRREWGRMSLEKVSKKKNINQNLIKSIIQNSKRDLFRKMKKDGLKICENLKLKKVHEKVSDTLGSLRYRYSFAQNQYFHCEEVGWLCGLLASELENHPDILFKARRAGLFHDIGKAMDHIRSGGHAMVGADFIKDHGEDEKIVHAVRAHHYDVRPQSYLDYLVIVADAISGSRPGARRSTVDSYNQKVMSLEKIGKSFDGVQDIYIMNAGREVRVIVDSKKIDDKQAIVLSRQISQRIEEECSYPGLIKVSVVRKVEVHQMTHQAS